MREVKVRLKMNRKTGISHEGSDEVNRLLKEGARLREIKGPNAIMDKIGESEGKVRLTFAGSEIIFLFDETEA